MRRAAPLVLLLAVATAVSAAPPPASPAPARTPSPTAAARLGPERLQVVVSEVAAEVERIRGLRFKTPVSMEIVDGATARAQFKAKITAGTEEQARHAQNAYVHLGLVPPGTDLLRNYLDQAESDVLGFYDHREKKLYLLSHVPASEVRGVVAHELTHALEDQHFDFEAVSRLSGGNDDHATAISSLIEGSAMMVQVTYGRYHASESAAEEAEQGELKRANRLRGAPSFVQQSVILPYLLGFSFVLRGRPWNFGEGVPVRDLAEAYANPPRSTTQILHPEQYWWGKWRTQPDPPQLPDLSPVLGPGWKKAAEGSIGELGLAVLTGSKLDVASIEALLPSRWTNEAASGTTGDVFHHYVDGTQTATVLLTRWETSRDVDQFDRTLRSRGRYFMRYGGNVLVMAGDIGEKGPDLARAAMSTLSYWPGR